MLKPWEERTAKQDQLPAVLGAVNGYLFQLKETRGFAFNLPEIIGLGTTAGLELNLQDRGVNDVTRFAGLAGEFAADANALPELRGVYPTIRVNTPQLFVQVDREKVKTLGISLSELFQTLQASLSTLYINDFNRYGKTYRVQAEAQSRFRQTPDDIGRLYVRGPNQQMVPVSALTRTEFRAGPSVITRFNGFTSALVVGAPALGKSSGEMLAAVERLAQDKYASRGVGYAYSGQSYQERASGGQGGLVFALGLVMVFLVLAAQYESWTIPFAVLLGVPFGTLGALLGVWLRGMANDVYVQIGLIVVVGLAAKNAILIVEFANELRAQGRSIREAALEAGRERLRPILMTSFAFILLAEACAVGPGYRRSSLGLPDGWRRPATSEDSLRSFYDSLRTSRDTLLPAGADTARVPFGYDTSSVRARGDSGAALHWVDLIQDSVLRQLVDTSLQANRDMRTALAVIDEFRAQYRATRGALLPELTANGRAGRNQTVFGTFGSFTYNVYQATARPLAVSSGRSAQIGRAHV